MTAPGYPTNEPNTNRCPSPRSLDQFVNLECSETESDIIRRHIAGCGACQTLLDNTSRSEGISPSLRPTVDAATDPTIERLVRGLYRDFHLEEGTVARPSFPIALEPVEDGQSLGKLNRYLIRRELASGGSGTVFEAIDPKTNAAVAIKFIRSSDRQLLRRVEREARATSKVQHENVVSVQSVDTAPDGRLFLVMPLIRGRSLAESLQEQGLLPFETTVRLVLQIAQGLAEVHRQGLLHRDVKPANIVLDGHGNAKLTDFGLASFVDEESSLTETGVAVGTPAYMSPEQTRNAADVDARSDIYSLGATLYECLTGTRPFRGRAHDVLRQILEREPIRPSLINDQVLRPLEAICLKAMSKSPAARYSRIELFIEDLTRWQQGKRVSARLPGLGQRFIKWLQRDPRLSLSLGAVLATLIVAGTVSAFYWSRSVEQSRLAASRFDASLQTINTLADLASQSLSGDPGLASIRKQIQTMADKAFEPLVSQRPTDAEGLVRYLQAMDNLGTIKHTVAGPAEALAFRQRMINDNQPSIAALSHNNDLRRLWAKMNHRLAVSHVEMRTYDQAGSALDEATKVLAETDTADRFLLGSVAHSRGTLHYWINSDNAKAAAEFRRAVEHFEAYAAAFPDDKLVTVSLSNTQGWLANCELQLGNVVLAEAMLRQVWARNAALADAPEGTYLNRLDKHRASLSLLNLLVARGSPDKALEWSREVGPDIDNLQASNPTLMEPAALKIGFGCDTVAAELLEGNFVEAKAQAAELLAMAHVLDQQFPKTTRVWQVLGNAKQMWLVCCLHVGDHETLIPFMDEWIAEIEAEIAARQNIGFNQQLLQMLRLNLAIALVWSGNAQRGEQLLEQMEPNASPNLKPAIVLLRQLSLRRTAIGTEQPLPFVLSQSLTPASFTPSLDELAGLLGAGNRYPSVHHALAECHALAAELLSKGEEALTDPRDLIEQHQQRARASLQAAKNAGFYQHGRRIAILESDPLLKPYVEHIEN